MERLLRQKLKGGKFENVPLARSKTMGAIKSKGNKTTEVRFRLALVRAGIRGWTVHPKGMVGNPDFLFQDKHLVVFIDGCFWHGCARCGHVPNTNRPYWSTKLERNMQRDQEKTGKLEEAGYQVLRFWEHELKEDLHGCITRLQKNLPAA
jgi:DNA mismatch endonuclease (patch repair protein)